MPDSLATNCLTVGKQKDAYFMRKRRRRVFAGRLTVQVQAVMDTTHQTRLSFAVSVDRNYLKSDQPSLPLISTFYAVLSSPGNPH